MSEMIGNRGVGGGAENPWLMSEKINPDDSGATGYDKIENHGDERDYKQMWMELEGEYLDAKSKIKDEADMESVFEMQEVYNVKDLHEFQKLVDFAKSKVESGPEREPEGEVESGLEGKVEGEPESKAESKTLPNNALE